MSFLSVVGKVKAILGIITDALLIGRTRGWWSKKHEVEFEGKTPSMKEK